jgi:hypothetical protein
MKTLLKIAICCLASATYAVDSSSSLDSDENYCIAEYKDSSGSGTYKGPCNNGLPHGLGEVRFNNGARLNGEFVDGAVYGEVVYHAADGSIYKGNWEKGKRQGRGTYSWAQGSRYEGEWIDDQRHGEGVFTWSNGNRFVGVFKNNKRYNGNYYTNKGYVYKCRLGQCR